MTKEELIEIMMLLSALESWSYATGNRMPEYLLDRLDNMIGEIRREILGKRK